MATKPTLADSRWAVNGSNVDAANVSAPTSGQRDTGYTLNQVPPSSVENYLRNRVYRWLQYLNDGAFTGNHSITGTLTVSALATLASAAVTGATTLAGTLGVTGPATLNSTLSVTGAITPTGGINAFTANGLITANGGATIPSGQTLTVTGTTTIAGQTRITGSITPPALTAGSPQNNYNPTGLANATVIYQPVTASNVCGITGLAGGSDGRVILLFCSSGAGGQLLLENESASSTAANRFALPSATVNVLVGGGCMLIYDGTAQRWRIATVN